MGPDIAPGSGVPLAAAPGSQGGFAMGLAVPGLTVPWGHAGYLWIATAAAIAIHEVHLCCMILAHCLCVAAHCHMAFCPFSRHVPKHGTL